MFKEGSPSVSADFQAALRLHYKSIINEKNLITIVLKV